MTDVEIDQGAARAIDRKVRLNPLEPMNEGAGVTGVRIRAMIEAGVRTIELGAPKVPSGILHRLAKTDTVEGLKSLQSIAESWRTVSRSSL